MCIDKNLKKKKSQTVNRVMGENPSADPLLWAVCWRQRPESGDEAAFPGPPALRVCPAAEGPKRANRNGLCPKNLNPT